MGKPPVKKPTVLTTDDAKKVGEFLRNNPPKLRGLTITPLGAISTHFLQQIQSGNPGGKTRVVSGTVSRSGGKTRVGAPDIDLAKKAAPGTPEPSDPSARNTTTVRLENPLLEIDEKTGQLRGLARLSVDDAQYPQGLVDPTVLQLHISSDPLKTLVDDPQRPKFDINAEYGPIQADLKLKLKFDVTSLSRQEIVQAVASGNPDVFIDRLSTPGFDLSGLVQFAVIKNIPVLNKILRTKISMWAPSTKPIERPLRGAPTGHELYMQLFGIIPVPAGAIFETQSLGYGITGQSWTKSTGSTYSVAGLAVPSPTKLSEVSLYLYINYFKVWRVSDGWELSINLNFSPSKVVGGETKAAKDLQLQWKEASDRSWLTNSDGNFVHADKKPMFFGEAKLSYAF